jgi:hypothetical protein
MSERYQCCFCGNSISAIIPDVAGLLYTTSVDREPSLQRDQQLWCHTKCLRERLHPSAKLYAADLVEDLSDKIADGR